MTEMAGPAASSGASDSTGDQALTPTFIGILIVELACIVALYALGAYFR